MKNFLGSQRFLAIYSGVLTLIFAVALLGGFAPDTKKTSLDEITVHRINIVEPDGTLRMVISNKASAPGIIIKGQEHPHPDRKTAGVLFFNDEGTENGGLIFGGMKEKDSKGSSFGHLSFDAYEQDQVFTIDAGQEGDKRSVGLSMVDRPNYPISELIVLTDRIKNLTPEEQKAEIAKFSKSHEPPHPRLYLGRGDDKSVSLKLKDVNGKDRIVIEVAPDGSPMIRFLDATGKVISQLPAAAKE
jgi:hypothetical protein